MRRPSPLTLKVLGQLELGGPAKHCIEMADALRMSSLEIGGACQIQEKLGRIERDGEAMVGNQRRVLWKLTQAGHELKEKWPCSVSGSTPASRAPGLSA